MADTRRIIEFPHAGGELEHHRALVAEQHTMTEPARQMLRDMVAEVLQEAASGVTVRFASTDDLAAFVRAEVRKALADELRKVALQGGPH